MTVVMKRIFSVARLEKCLKERRRILRMYCQVWGRSKCLANFLKFSSLKMAKSSAVRKDGAGGVGRLSKGVVVPCRF